MAHRAVIAAVEPLLGEHVRQLQDFGDFGAGEAVIHEAHGLVVQEFVGVAVAGQEGLDFGLAETRNAVGGEHHVALRGEEADGFREVIGPGFRVAHLGAAGGQQVVHGQIGVFGHEYGAELRQEEIHLRRRFGAWCQLEHHGHVAYRDFLAGMGD